jgi:hypothetical protein
MVEEDMMDLLILAMTSTLESIIAKMSLAINHEFISIELRHIEVFQKGD